VNLTVICDKNWPSSICKMTRIEGNKFHGYGWNYLSWYKRCL
jgi:hypothetical protein